VNTASPLFYAAPVIAGVLSAVLAKALGAMNILPDQPNERSLHHRAIPRAGGIGVLAGIIGGALLTGLSLPVVWIAFGLAIVSLADDHWSLPALLRLLLHFVAALVFVMSFGPWPASWLFLFLVFGLVWMTNLYNFMDGADGLAGGMAIFGFGACAAAASIHGHAPIAMLSFCIVAAAAGFLLFNYPPARIFMGDVGSVPLGFMAGAIGLTGWKEGIWPLIFPFIAFAPFIVDATVTLLRRALRKERVWQAHREHFYQRLVLSGWTHRRLAIAEYAMMLVCSVSAVLLTLVPSVGVILISLGVGLLLLGSMIMIDKRWRLFLRAHRA